MQYFTYTQAQISALQKADPQLGAAIKGLGLIRRVVMPDLFTALVNAIVGQQISPKAQETVWGRVMGRLPEMTPQAVLNIAPEALQKCGMSGRKVRYIRSAAEQICSGTFDIEQLVHCSDQEVCKRLSSLPGIGTWTAEMLLLFSLQRQNIFSAGDAGIRKGLCRLHNLDAVDDALFAHYKALYSPNGSVASIYLWEIAAGKLTGF